MTASITQSARHYEEMKRRLLAEVPALEQDEQALLDTLEGCTDLHEQIAELVRSAVLDQVVCTGLKDHIARLQDRLGTLKARAEKKRAIALNVMEMAGIKTVAAVDMTITRAALPPKALVTDASLLPKEYTREKVETRPDLTAIKEALKAGESVPGCQLSNGGETLKVRI